MWRPARQIGINTMYYQSIICFEDVTLEKDLQCKNALK